MGLFRFLGRKRIEIMRERTVQIRQLAHPHSTGGVRAGEATWTLPTKTSDTAVMAAHVPAVSCRYQAPVDRCRSVWVAAASVGAVVERAGEPDRLRWRQHGERIVYDSPWVRVTKVDVTPPDGQRFEHHAVRLQTVASAVVIDSRGSGVVGVAAPVHHELVGVGDTGRHCR